MFRSRVLNVLIVALAVGALFCGCSGSGKYPRANKYDQQMRIQQEAEDAEILAGIESLPDDLGKKNKDVRVAYTVGPDDVLQVEVRQHAEAGGQFLVSPEGTIFIPLIGSVEVEDLTTDEIREKLEEQYGEYLRDPEVGVFVSHYASKKVYVLGQVRNPGEYNMKGNTLTVREAILEAGLPLDTANLPRVLVITPDDFDPEIQVVNLDNILYKGIMIENIDLRPDDVVVVHRHILAKIGEFLNQILGPTARVRAAADLAETLEGRD